MASKKGLLIFSIPIRMVAAVGFVILGYKLPYVALGILVLALFFGTVGICLSFLIRKAFRRRSRTKCSGCDYRPFQIAKICPKCHTPLLVSSLKGLDENSQDILIKTAISLAWSDGSISEDEAKFLEGIIRVSQLPQQVKENLYSYVKVGLRIEDSGIDRLPESLGDKLMTVSASIIVSDGQLLDSERQAFNKVATIFGFTEKKALKVLHRFQKEACI